MKNIIYLVFILFVATSCLENEDILNEENTMIDKTLLSAKELNKFSKTGITCYTKGKGGPLPLSNSEINNELLFGTPRCETPIVTKHIKIQYHVLRDDSGAGGFNESELNEMTESLKEAFSSYSKNQEYNYSPQYNFDLPVNREELHVGAPVDIFRDITFKQHSVTHINNSQLYLESIEPEDVESTLFVPYSVSGVLNIFIVDKLFSGNTGEGFALISGNSLVVNRLGAKNHVLPHEVGHSLGLYHPFYLSDELCFSEEENTSSLTGDMIGDTPLLSRPLTAVHFNNCRFIGDINYSLLCPEVNFLSTERGDFLGKNYMGYGDENCTDRNFTLIQYLQMSRNPIIWDIADITSISYDCP